MKRFLALLLLLSMFAAAWLIGDQRETIVAANAAVRATDGDSFTIGPNKLRLDGIDAPEYRQTCRDEAGRDWPCGKAARAALEKLLLEPGLACDAGARDQYARAVATCRTAHTPDIGAAQVSAGMAVTHEFAGMRDYGAEEDRARAARSGIWRGEFVRPDEWRATANSAD